MKSCFDVLLVDDDPIVRRALERALRSVGLSVTAAGEGATAFALFAQNSYRLLITDVLMPNTDGYELMLHARKYAPETRMLAMSAGGRVGEASCLLRAAEFLGAHATLEKPFEIDQFLAAVHALLDPAAKERSRSNELRSAACAGPSRCSEKTSTGSARASEAVSDAT